MKITIIDENLDVMGGVERIICVLANELSKENNVTVINQVKKNKDFFFKYNKRIRIENILDQSNSYTSKCDYKNYKYYFIRFFQKIKEKVVLSFIPIKIRKILISSDTIIFGRATTSIKYLKYFKQKKICKKIIVRDASHLGCVSNSNKKKIKKYFPHMVNVFIVSSDESKKEYEEFFKSKTINIVKLYNPLGIIPKIKYNYAAKTVVSIGRLDEQKGFENLLLAFKIFNKQFKNWHLIIYGNGKYKRKLEEFIKKNKIKNSKIKPAVKDVVEVFNNSSIYVMSSRFEGYANTLVEALACGIPSISYDWLMGAEEIITNEENGIIVSLKNRQDYFNGKIDETDIKTLALALKKLAANKKKCDYFSKESPKIINTRNTKKIMESWKKIIE